VTPLFDENGKKCAILQWIWINEMKGCILKDHVGRTLCFTKVKLAKEDGNPEQETDNIT